MLDAAGKPAVSYILSPDEGYNVTVALWHPGDPAGVKVMDTNGKQTDGPAAQVTAAGSQLAAIFYGSRDEEFFDNHHVWFTHSTDNGATWAPAAVIADDGGHSWCRR